MAQPYLQLLDVKRWADRGLYGAVSRDLDRLSAEDASLMLRVLDHMHVVDRIFQHHLQGLPHGFKAPRSEAMPALPMLAAGTEEVDDWYVAYASSATADELDEPIDLVFTSGKPLRMRRSEILLHVCQHGAYHRGNAGALMQLRGLVPGRDAVTDFLEAAAA